MQVPHLGQRPVALFSGHFQHRSKNKQLTPGEKEPSDQVFFLYGAPIRAISKAKSTESSKPPLVQYPSLASLLSALRAAENKPAEPEREIHTSTSNPKVSESEDPQKDDWLDFFGAHIRPVPKTPETTAPARAWIPYPSLRPHQSSIEMSEPDYFSEQKSSHRNKPASREPQAQDTRQETPLPFYGAKIPAIVTTPEEPDTPPRFQYPSLRQFLDS